MRGYAIAEVELESFDRRCRIRARVQRPDRYRLLEALPADLPRIARGSGASYVGASFGADAISQDLSAFDRLLAFDRERGRLRVEAGARIGDVQRFALAHGWYLPIAPGHPASSIGGCIAADVHGKNPARDGTFRNQVEAVRLLHPQAGWVRADATENTDLLAATCAGFGLTGTIVDACLRLAPAPEAFAVRRIPVRDLAAAADALREHAQAPLLYGWHDGRPGRFGRGAIRYGLEAEAPRRRPRRVHPDLPAAIAPLPFAVWHRFGIAAANAWLGRTWGRAGQETLPVAAALFPLNAARNYFAGFGRAGFAEAQWLLPHRQFGEFAGILTDLVARKRPRIALISSKLFAGTPSGLGFDGDGIALALHLPAPDAPVQRGFLEALTELALTYGGRPNLIKDSTLDTRTLERAIPDFAALRARLRTCDPQGLFRSELARRLAL